MSNPDPFHHTPSGLAMAGRRCNAALLMLTLATVANAAPFRLVSSSVDAGGGHAQSARFAVEGSVGQPDAGLADSARFRVEGGFWPTTVSPPGSEIIFSNSFED